jgi:predicted nucleotidyltransferase
MPSRISDFISKGVTTGPKWIQDNMVFEAKSGSFAYGVATETSDIDYTGYCIAPKNLTFYIDEIPGFGRQKQRFEQYNEQITFQKEKYDLTCYNIVKYFNLCMECNPNMVETLFYPNDCITYCSMIGQRVRDSRKMFLHKGAYHKLKGYAYSQLSAANKVKDDSFIREIRAFEVAWNIPHTTTYAEVCEEMSYRAAHGVNKFRHIDTNSINYYKNLFEKGLSKTKRFESQKIHNADTKFMYHVARLTNYARQILTDYDLDVRQDREYWKAIRRGEVTVESLQQKFEEEERQLQRLYETSKISHSPDEPAIKALLLSCLEEHYGTLAEFETESKYVSVVNEINEVLRKWKV